MTKRAKQKKTRTVNQSLYLPKRHGEFGIQNQKLRNLVG